MSFLQIVFDVSLSSNKDEEILIAHLLNYGFDSFESLPENWQGVCDQDKI